MAPPRTTVPPIQEVSDAPPTTPPRPSGMLLPFDPILLPGRDRAVHRLAADDRRRDRRRHRRPAALLRHPPGDLLRRRDAPRADPVARRLLAAARAQVRRLRAAHRLDPGGAAARLGRARITARDRHPVLLVPGLRARQGPARRRPVGVHRRPLTATAGARHHRPDHAPHADPGGHGDRAAGPRLRDGLHRHRARHALRGRHRMASLRRRCSRSARSRSHSPSWSRRRWA